MVSGNQFVSNGWAIRVLGDAIGQRLPAEPVRGELVRRGSHRAATATICSWRTTGTATGATTWITTDSATCRFSRSRLFAFLVQQSPPTLILLHSFFIDLLDLAERAVPALTPETLMDPHPLMRWSTS